MTREEATIQSLMSHIKALEETIKTLEQKHVLNNIRAEIKVKIEEEEFVRSVFYHEEKDYAKARECTGSIIVAYNNVIKLIDKYNKI